MRTTRIGVLLLVAWCLAAATVPAIAQQAAAGAAAPEPVDAAPVVIDGTELLVVRGIRSIPARQRAAEVEQRLRDLARDPSFDPATLRIVDTVRGAEILAGDDLLLVATVLDAEADGLEPRLWAEAHLPTLRRAITRYREARTRSALIAASWRAALATLVALLLIAGLRKGAPYLDRSLERRFGERLKSVSISSFEVVRVERIRGVVRGLARTVSGLALLVLVYLYLRYALSLFPWTVAAAADLRRWVLAPLVFLAGGFLRTLPDLVFLAVLFVVVRWVLQLLRAFFAAVGRGEVKIGDFQPAWAQPTYSLMRLAVVALALVVAYPYIPGSSSAAFKGISVFIGVVFSLGSSSVIANVLAGYSLIYRRAFSPGDLVKIGDTLGFVTRSRLQATYLRSMKNEEVVIPNSTIQSTEVVNYSTLAKSHGLVLHTTVGIGYETPWRQVEAMLVEAARRTPGTLAEPAPFVHQLGLGEFAVTYELNVHIDDPVSMRRLYTELHRRILDVFNEYGVQIMTPSYEADASEPKVVPPDKWYLAPADPET